MYGTVARMRVRPGEDEALVAWHERWVEGREQEASGFVADYVVKSDRIPGEWIVLLIFDSKANYRKNAADPRQHRQYQELRALLVADPEWNDGEVISVEPSAVPV